MSKTIKKTKTVKTSKGGKNSYGLVVKAKGQGMGQVKRSGKGRVA